MKLTKRQKVNLAKCCKKSTVVLLDIPPEFDEHYVAAYESLLGVENNRGSDSLVLCLGEISNMRGHYVFVNRKTGKTIWGLDLGLFRMPTKSEF